jgi:cytochrome c nitrite reductase small subunit
MATAMKPAPLIRRVLSIVAAALSGAAVGAAIFGIGYSELPSYFGTAPETCANCHVMQATYDSWSNGPHANVATCNDCHLPHDGIIAKYMVKAEDGVLHGYKFTTGTYPENIVIRQSSLDVVNTACVSCHDTMTDQMRISMGATGDSRECSHCHSTIGHD